MNIVKPKIALLGVSHWHVPLYLKGLDQGIVAAVSDPNAALAEKYASKFNCQVYGDYLQMLKEVKPDFVFAFAPHYMMADVAKTLIAAKIAFTIEKPAGLSSKQVEDVYDQAEQSGVFCAIPFVWRYSDLVNKLKEQYLKSDIVHMSYKFIAGSPERYLETSPWMLEKNKAGGGCMTNLGVHFIDMALYLTDSTKADVLASCYQFTSKYDIETYASSLLQIENGASLVLETGYAYPMTKSQKRENRWNIVTKKGYYTLAENNLEMRVFDNEVSNIELDTDSDPYYEIFARTTLSDFIDGRSPRSSLKEMLNVSIILDKMNNLARKTMERK